MDGILSGIAEYSPIVAFISALLWYLIKTQTERMNKSIEDVVGKLGDVAVSLQSVAIGMDRMLESMERHDERSKDNMMRMLSEINSVRYSQSQCKLLPEHTIIVVESIVKAASVIKIRNIRQMLIENHIYDEPDLKREKLREMLVDETNKYITVLNNKFSSPIGNLGDWVLSNFEFESFFTEVCKYFFKIEDKDDIIGKKCDNITIVMLSFQGRMITKLRNELKKHADGMPSP